MKSKKGQNFNNISIFSNYYIKNKPNKYKI